MRLEGGWSRVGMSVGHLAHCPEVDPISCAEGPIPEHKHALQVVQHRARLGLSIGLGSGWQLSVSQPIELRVSRVGYLTLDGRPFDPPYADIHHRDEVLRGPGDGSVLLQYGRLEKGARGGNWMWMGEGGFTLPFGNTEENPYALGEAGLRHQHQQLGSGIPLFQAGIQVRGVPRPWGGRGGLNLRLPVGENGFAYRPPSTVAASGGVVRAFGRRVQGDLGLTALREGPEFWAGEAYAGRSALQADLRATLLAPAHWDLSIELRQPVAQHLDQHGHGGGAEDGWLKLHSFWGLNLGWTGAAPARPK